MFMSAILTEQQMNTNLFSFSPARPRAAAVGSHVDARTTALASASRRSNGSDADATASTVSPEAPPAV